MWRTLKSFWQKMRAGIPAPEPARQHEPDTIRQENQALDAELGRVRSELATVTAHNTGLITTLQRRIVEMEDEREQARRQMEELRSSLADTTERQSEADRRIEKLGLQLASAQRKQQDLADAAAERERRQESHLKRAMLVAVLALLLGALAGGAMFHNASRTTELLAQLGSDLADIKETIRQQADAMQSRQQTTPRDQVKETIAGLAREAQTPPGPAQQQQRESQTDDRTPSSTTGPHTRSGYRTRREMERFFAANADRAEMISLAEGLQYRVLSEGNGHSPVAGDRLVLDYSTRLLDGTEIFDSHHESTPASFALEQFAPGLRQALARMQEGAQWEIYVSPDLAYRGNVRNRKRFGYEPLVYVVDLIAVVGDGSELQQQAITQ